MKLNLVSGRDMCKILEMSGFVKIHQVGSHVRYVHPDGYKTVVPVHGTEMLGRYISSGKETFNLKFITFKTMTAAQKELNKLEKKVELLSKAMHLLLFEKKEALSRKESKEIEKRLSAYLKGKKSEFVNLEDVTNAGSKNTQKRTKRA